ncbi:cytochrome P450 704C1-like [Benincasa hispida]|uniref:cytochrome P450 704C1-like n=1 Tax=Benincasa hispida TaxID=102211 RepID=UPI001901D1F0|nr:cytochrome P450 704C1-like [Benincasa hispida]
MEILSNPISVAAVLLLISIVVRQILTRKPRKKKYHPIAGTVFHQLLNFHRLQDYMTDLARKHKTYRLLGPFRNEVYTSDPPNVEYILRTNFDNFGKGSHNYRILSVLLGDGIFTVDGEKWRQQRKISSYEFSTKVLRDYSSVIFQKTAVKLANIVSEAAISNRVIDIQDLFMKSTLDSILHISFGIDLDSLHGSNEEVNKFCSAFEASSTMTLWRYVDVSWPIKKTLNIGSEAVLKENMKIVDEYIYKLIHTALEQREKLGDNALVDEFMRRENIVSRFLQAETTDPKYLRDIILNFVIAGKDTTAVTLAWFICMLCKHLAVQERVAREIMEVTNVEDVTDFAEFAARLTEEALEKMQFLTAAINETLRLYPPVPVDAKICFSDDTLPDGFSVRKGDMVAYQPFAMGRMKFIWGDDAEEFRPERWFDGDGNFQPQSPFKFTAFQAGPRICLGKEFAYRQIKIVSALLLSCFKFKMSDEKKIVEYQPMINLLIKEGLQVCAISRRPMP